MEALEGATSHQPTASPAPRPAGATVLTQRSRLRANPVIPRRYEMLSRQLYTRINPQTGHTWGRTEPGWDERDPERPRLMAKWVERCFNATTVAMLARQGLIWPQDLLEDFLAGQRPAPATTVKRSVPAPASSVEDSNVVDFDRFRHQRRA